MSTAEGNGVTPLSHHRCLPPSTHPSIQRSTKSTEYNLCIVHDAEAECDATWRSEGIVARKHGKNQGALIPAQVEENACHDLRKVKRATSTAARIVALLRIEHHTSAATTRTLLLVDMAVQSQTRTQHHQLKGAISKTSIFRTATAPTPRVATTAASTAMAASAGMARTEHCSESSPYQKRRRRHPPHLPQVPLLTIVLNAAILITMSTHPRMAAYGFVTRFHRTHRLFARTGTITRTNLHYWSLQQPRYPARSKFARYSSSVRDENSSIHANESNQTTLQSIVPNVCSIWLDRSLSDDIRCIGIQMKSVGDSSPHSLTLEQLRDIDADAANDHWISSWLHPDELEYGILNRKVQVETFALGRLALRLALGYDNSKHAPILCHDDGRPRLPEGYCGSITHKVLKSTGDVYAVAVVKPTTTVTTDACEEAIGVDLEETSKVQKRNIAKRILTPHEMSELGGVEDVTVEEEVLLRFSLKEAIYKATNAYIGHYVGFQQAEVTPYSDGTAECKWLLESNADENIASLATNWEMIDDGKLFLTWARARRKKTG